MCVCYINKYYLLIYLLIAYRKLSVQSMVSHQHVETRHYWPSPPQDYTHAAMLQPPSCGCSRLNDRIRRSRAATRLDSRKVYRCLPQRPFGLVKNGKMRNTRTSGWYTYSVGGRDEQQQQRREQQHSGPAAETDTETELANFTNERAF